MKKDAESAENRTAFPRIDLHTHSVFCDGKDTPEEMVEAAIAKRMEAIGVCVHSHTPHDESYCASLQGMRSFLAEMQRLKEKYDGRIRVLAGAEQDLFSDADVSAFDYVIGSVHYLKHRGHYFEVDGSEACFRQIVGEQFGGDFYACADLYFEEVSSILELTHADIVGHLDLMTKFNEGGKLFNENDPRYLAAAKKCIDRLIPYGRPFEINTGAMHRAYRTGPYPSHALRAYIREKGGCFILSSDTHSADHLMYAFEAFADEADKDACTWLYRRLSV
ncbi:MAG: histidinol-phosphatase HisJ family protein [Lachnospiraceae bacterium]|nr:histidinol-phosphatase HisJ family protein [Lachnospiraceae bacterium]